MTNAELIKALRWCGSEDERHEMCVDESYRCPMWNEDRITDECKAELMHDAADALEAADKRIAELIPKEGEWIEDEYGYIHCSKCKMEWDEPEHPQTKYCPNCGARMKGANDEQD